MRKIIYGIIIIQLFLICMPGMSFAANPKIEVEYEYLTPRESDREIDTTSVHILEKVSQTKNRSVYRGITVTRPRGTITLDDEVTIRESSANGIGPIVMVRNEKYHSGKLSAAVDMSGGFILYNRAFPAGGRAYNFMWRLGPQLIYNFNENTSLNIGYMVMHVSNGFRSHNPGYNAHGISVGFATKF